MTAAELTRLRLLDVSAVTALVSTRIYTLLVKAGSVMPCVRVQTISGSEDMHLRGSYGLRRARVQVDAIASVKTTGVDALASARTVSEAAHGDGAGSGLCGWTGTVNGSPGVDILAILPLSDAVERYTPDEQEYVTVSRDYAVHYRTN